ncbi:MAG: hypothetical protein IPJ19_18485 [Planctomycetes bacterium]|nr:hypothetical protein [Planctomycetota bacterium]
MRLALACAAVLAVGHAARAEGFVIAAQGKALCSIAVAEQADPAERHAAEELAHFLGEISGARFELVTPDRAGPASILVGRAAVLARITPQELSALGDEGYLVRTSAAAIAIAGNTPRGTLYGAYALLEEQLGCRWFTPEVAHIPKLASPSFPQAICASCRRSNTAPPTTRTRAMATGPCATT